MAEVGVLNLTIKDNSEQAGKGLDHLADALTAVKTAVGKGLGLGVAATQLSNLASKVSENSKALNSIGTFLNAISAYQKAFKDTEKVKFNSKPIEDLKNAIGDGIKLGQAGTQLNKVREAITGDWGDNGNGAGSTMTKIAEGAKELSGANAPAVITKTAAAIEKYAEAVKKIASGGAHDLYNQMSDAAKDWQGSGKSTGRLFNIQLLAGKKQVPGQMMMDLDGTAQKISEIVSQMNITESVVSKITRSVDSTLNQFNSVVSSDTITSPVEMISNSIRNAANNVRYYGNALDAVLPKINAFSSAEMIEAGNARLAIDGDKELAMVLAEMSGKIKPINTDQSQEVVEGLKKIHFETQSMNIALAETGDIVTSVVIPRFQDMYRIWSEWAYEFNAFKMEAGRLMSGSSQLLLGDGRTAGQLLLGDGTEPQTFLSTWVDVREQFRTDWVSFTSDVAEQWRAAWSPDWILGGWKVPQSMSMFHLGAGSSPLLLGDGGVSPEKTLSTMVDYSEQWKQDWIIGEGTVSDVAEETERVAASTRDATQEAEKYDKVFANILQEKEKEAKLAEQIRAQRESMFYSGERKHTDISESNAMADGLTQLDLLQAKLREAEFEYNKFVNTLGAGSSKAIKKGLEVQKLRDSICQYKNDLEEANKAEDASAIISNKLTSVWNGLKGGIERMFPTLTGLIKRFGQIVKYRMLRSILKHITSGFSEGVKNVYEYSKAVGTSLAPAMDQAATALQQMKNSIGAAVAPVIQALVPVLQTVVSWFITAINYLNQFFALLNGQNTWTRALPEQAEAFEKSTKSAKSASKATKDLLADWDELNIIQSQSNGGGAGAAKTAEEYSQMFEEVNEFSQSVKDIVNFINDHLGGIPGILKKAGAILLGWKLGKAFLNGINTLKSLSVMAGLTLSIVGITLSADAGYSIGKNGLSPANLAEAIGGIASSALGGALIGWSVGGPAGAIVGLTIGAAISAVVLAININKGHIDSLYGEVSKDVEEIRKELQEANLFTTDSSVQIEVLHAHIKNIEDAEGKVSAALNDLNKTYPVGVEINPGNAADLKAKVDALVIATNTLINQSSETMQKLYVAATPVFTSNFVSEAWDSVSSYVSELGKLIGEELSKDITDNTNLEQLKQDLVNISTAVLTAKNSSEFAGKVGVLGAAVREETSLGKYNKETVANYIKEFNKTSLEKFGEATGQAELEYQEISRLAAALNAELDAEYAARGRGQGLLSDEEFEELKRKVLAADIELNSWDEGRRVADRAREIFEEWTAAGYALFSDDILNVLSGVMNQNHNNGMRNTAISYATYGEGEATDEWVDKYLAGNKSWLESVIAKETGMSEEDIKNLINNTGINPLSFFDEGFVQEYRNKIVDWLGKSKLTDSQVSRVLASIGIDDAEIQKRIKEVQEDRASKTAWENANNDFSEWLQNNLPFTYQPPTEAELAEMQRQAEESQGKYQRPWWDFLGITYTPPEQDTSDTIIDENDIRNKTDGITQEIKNKITEAMMDGIIDELERKEIIDEYGQKLYDKYTVELGARDTGMNPFARAAGVTAGMGVSDVGWAPYNYAPNSTESADLSDLEFEAEIDGQETDEQKQQNIKTGTGDLLSALNTLIEIVRAINQKDFSFNLNPTSGWGVFNNQAAAALSNITGEDIP